MRYSFLFLLFFLFNYHTCESQIRYGTWRDTSHAWQLTLLPTNFENGTKNVPGYDGDLPGRAGWSTAHIETGIYAINGDTLFMDLKYVHQFVAINDDYGFATEYKDTLFAYFFDYNNGPYKYVKLKETSFVIADTVSAMATWPGGVSQLMFFATGKSLLTNHPTWYGIDTMGVFWEGFDLLGNNWGWVQVGTTMYGVDPYPIKNPNNFTANGISVSGRKLMASTSVGVLGTYLDSLNFARWYNLIPIAPVLTVIFPPVIEVTWAIVPDVSPQNVITFK